MFAALVVSAVLAAGAAGQPSPSCEADLYDARMRMSMCSGEKSALESMLRIEQEKTRPICPLAADPDALVECPGWESRPCRERDRRGKLRRSSTIKREFLRRYGYPRGRPGHVLDHLYPLACGGCDVPWNIQFQTTADGKAKDKWERDVCAPDKDEEAIE